MESSAHVVGVDIGGTTIKAAVATADGELLSDVRLPTQRGSGEAILECFIEAIGQAIQQAGKVPEDISTVGIGAPGGVDREHGFWGGSTTIRLGMRVSVTDMVQEAFGIPAFLDNDGNVAALGERDFGAGSDVLDMIYVTLGSGVGGAVIIEGQIHYGRGRIAGEIGHMIVKIDGPLCGCGGHGCLEALSSATAIIREARSAMEGGQPTLIRDLVEGDPSKLNGEVVARAAHRGDEVALRIWREAGQALGAGVFTLDHLVGPEVIIIGGAVAQAGDILFDPMRERLQYDYRRYDPNLVRMAALGEKTGLMGGVALALRKARER